MLARWLAFSNVSYSGESHPLLPVDFSADDEVRTPQGTDGTLCDYPVMEEVDYIREQDIQNALNTYAPVRWVDYQKHYAEVVVEKIDSV
jgi:hypothetical protein